MAGASLPARRTMALMCLSLFVATWIFMRMPWPCSRGRKEPNKKTLPHIRQQLFPSDNHIIVYPENYFGLFAPLEFTETIASLEDKPRMKIVDKCRRLRREMKGVMTNPRPFL